MENSKAKSAHLETLLEEVLIFIKKAPLEINEDKFKKCMTVSKNAFINDSLHVTAVCIEKLLCLIDESTKDNKIIIDLFNYILHDSFDIKPEYDVLCSAVNRFINYRHDASVLLTFTMILRGCVKIVNPFSEMFLYMSKYNFDMKVLDEAYNKIKDQSTDDLQKTAIAGVCYYLYAFLFFDIEAAKDGYEVSLSSLNDDNFDLVREEWWKDFDSAFIWIGKGYSNGNNGFLLCINSTADSLRGEKYVNTSSIKLNPGNKHFITDKKVLFSKDRSILFHHIRKGNYPSDLVIPNTVITINDYAFFSCTKIEKITIQNSLFIGNKAFENCTGLKELVFSDNVTHITCGLASYSVLSNVMKYTYPVVSIINEETQMVNGYIPDVAIFAEGKRLDDVISELEIILTNFIYLSIKYSTEIPPPSPLDEIKKKWPEYDVSFVSTSKYYSGSFNGCCSLLKIILPKKINEIPKDFFPLNPGLKIFCHSGSYAEQYANENKISIEYIVD